MNLPNGTVTFLFTDIEGSTKLAQEHPDKWESLRSRHHAILQSAMDDYNGYVFQIIGDAFCVAFHTASDGLNAAIDAQHKLQSEDWGDTPIKARMGIHTGEAQSHKNEYLGYLTMSLVQRLMSAGHGGQMLLSNATENLLRGQLPKNVNLRDLGQHKFKDVIHTIGVFEVVVPDLQSDFPALRALNVFPNNLPAQLTSFVGREKELTEVRKLLQEAHMLTLIGPGGTGKTRLSIQSANESLPNYSDGIWLVELAPILDPLLVPRTIAIAIGLRDESQRPVIDMLCDYLREKQLLILLDNCEHLVDACAQLANKILQAAPNVRILASSREALGIAGEVTYRVPSLGLPDMTHLPSFELLDQYEAVRLFIDRATSAVSTFAVTNNNAPALAQICRRLDGIPLAIELAAAKIRVLSVEQIAKRLDDRFRLLTGGSRTALERHQTLRAAVDWSYNLLPPNEQVLFRRLSVFVGGWRLPAAESVCGTESASSVVRSDDILNLMEQLINKSLVIIEETQGESRYRMLETMRQYANEKLVESGEAERLRDNHLNYFVQYVELVGPKLGSAEQPFWLKDLEMEHDNVRSALDWAAENDSAELGMRLADALWYFWWLHGHLSEGRAWCKRLLALPGAQAKTLARTGALVTGGLLASFQSGYNDRQVMLGEALVLAREQGEAGKLWLVRVLNAYADPWRHEEGAFSVARSLAEEALQLAREIGDPWMIGWSFLCLGKISNAERDYAAAFAAFEESERNNQQTGDPQIVGVLDYNIGSLLIRQGEYSKARSIREHNLAVYQEIGVANTNTASVLDDLGYIALNEGDYELAYQYFDEALEQFRKYGARAAAAWMPARLGLAAEYQGEWAQAQQLMEESLVLSREVGAQDNIAYALWGLGHLAKRQGNDQQAGAFLKPALGTFSLADPDDMISVCLDGMAALLARAGQVISAAQLFGSAAARRTANQEIVPAFLQAEYEADVDTARAKLSEAEFTSAWELGLKMTTEEAVELALKTVKDI